MGLAVLVVHWSHRCGRDQRWLRGGDPGLRGACHEDFGAGEGRVTLSKHNKHPVELLSTREMCSIVPVKDLHILVAGTEWVVEGGVGRIEAWRPV